jgi:23S rRNA 5-hydroxycytidine C2501 synthase
MIDYHKAGLVAVRDGRVLLCRKRHSTSLLILPGGSIEPGESAEACLRRELVEELGEVSAGELRYLGTYTDRAAADDPAVRKTVRIELFAGELRGEPVASSEIGELVWFGAGDDRSKLAPSLARQIFPDLEARGLLPWGSARVELLAPARDLECGRAAIDCGADAVYIGAPRFGARKAAGNALADIVALARHAHKYWARVYATLNTLLRDEEIEPARALAWQLYEAGVDGLILQDTGLIECGLPPIPRIASTQMHNDTPERVAFLERAGFRRVILARELTLAEIREIRSAAPWIELECFIHGALCVCYSGQCYLSYALGGRSGNRGECAQPCRKPYALSGLDQEQPGETAHWLSLRDLNLSGQIPELLDAGIRSFKIEGRLKDRAYVANTVAFYRARIDDALRSAGFARNSSGTSAPGFSPDLSKTFHRGFTTYFLQGRGGRIGSPETPKMTGEPAGRVLAATASEFTIETKLTLRAGDGLCFFDGSNELRGTVVNAVRGTVVVPDRMDGIEPGLLLYRNHDHEFLGRVNRAVPERRIGVKFRLAAEAGGVALEVEDEDGNRAAALAGGMERAADPAQALATIRRQMEKTGGTEFACRSVLVDLAEPPFACVAEWNALRRDALARLSEAREANRLRPQWSPPPDATPYPESRLRSTANVLNRFAEAFYKRHGVVEIERAPESGLDLRGRKVMTTRYCLLEQLALCPRETGEPVRGPVALVDENGRRLGLRFDCAQCRMEVWLEE